MPLDEKEKEALKKRYKEHRQAIWSGKHSRKSKKKKAKRDVVNFANTPPKETIKAKIAVEQPAKSVTNENTIPAKKRHSLLNSADQEKNEQIVILRRTKEKKSTSETPTKIMPPVSERTTLYVPESTRKTEEKLPASDDKKTTLEQACPRAKRGDERISMYASSLNVAESSTRLETNAKLSTSTKNMLKEKIKNQRQEIWSGTSSKKGRSSNLEGKNIKELKSELETISAHNSPESREGLTLGVVFIGIAAVVAAIILGVLLGYLLA
jgi:hypothetical protein